MKKAIFSPKNNVRLCLGGGGALGFAHIGAIKALEEHNIFPTQISGTSMGAIIGVFYAAGYSPDAMLQIIEEEKLYKLSNLFSFKINILNGGLTQNKPLRALVRKRIPHNSFEGLEKKLTVCTSQMNKAQSKLISSGKDLDKWVVASSCIPAIFEPIKDGKNWYVDGGVLNNFPAQAFKKNRGRTIGIDVLPPICHQTTESKSTLGVLETIIRVTEHNNSQEGRSCCRYIIEPMLSAANFTEFSFNSYKEIIQLGYEETTKYIKNNPRILKLSQEKTNHA